MIVHSQGTLTERDFKELEEPAQEQMPTYGKMRNLHAKYNIVWQGIRSFRTEAGWKFYLAPDAKPGFTEEPMMPRKVKAC